jgi:hypothetical protein
MQAVHPYVQGSIAITIVLLVTFTVWVTFARWGSK